MSAANGAKTADVCRKHGISAATFYKFKAKFGGMEVSDARRLKAPEDENARLKKPLVEQMQFFKAALLSTLLGVGTEIGSSNNENEIAKAIRESAQDTASDVGRQIVRRLLNIHPTLTIRPGFPVRVIVNRDLVMQPYGAAKERS